MKKIPLVKAFGYALDGMISFIRNDRNGKIHLVAVAVVALAGICFQVSTMEWAILLLCFSVVLSFEMMNHALEKLCDLVHEATHPLIKTTKDVAAAAVLWSALISIAIGLLIFLPKIMSLL